MIEDPPNKNRPAAWIRVLSSANTKQAAQISRVKIKKIEAENNPFFSMKNINEKGQKTAPTTTIIKNQSLFKNGSAHMNSIPKATLAKNTNNLKEKYLPPLEKGEKSCILA